LDEYTQLQLRRLAFEFDVFWVALEPDAPEEFAAWFDSGGDCLPAADALAVVGVEAGTACVWPELLFDDDGLDSAEAWCSLWIFGTEGINAPDEADPVDALTDGSAPLPFESDGMLLASPLPFDFDFFETGDDGPDCDTGGMLRPSTLPFAS
jgi:hypothetical protein